MSPSQRLTDWLETNWINPAYGGWVLGGLSLFFFIAATNTLSGWLYVLSGAGMAIVMVGGYLARQGLDGIRISRGTIEPVSAGDRLSVTLRFQNETPENKFLLQVADQLPIILSNPAQGTIPLIESGGSWEWHYDQVAAHRGIYQWETVALRTAAPLGLFWYRRSLNAKAKAIVYPTVLSLGRCPLIDHMGQAQNPRMESDAQPLHRPHQRVTEITRTLRPYRWGDPMRFIHWRSSARYSELRVRELEVFQGGQDWILCLDSHFSWRDAQPNPQTPQIVESFEQAVVAAASLYFYAQKLNLPVKLWTADRGMVEGKSLVLETLAATQPGEPLNSAVPTHHPLVWLTQNPLSTHTLPQGSQWLLWAEPPMAEPPRSESPMAEPKTEGQPEFVKGSGRYINSVDPLIQQLQEAIVLNS